MKDKLIAIIDNDIVFANALASKLNSIGVQTVVIDSALELLSVLFVDRPDYIIVDTMLSWIDPYQFLESLYKNPALSDIKVFLMTRQQLSKGRSKKRETLMCFHKITESDLLIEKIREEIS
ncbi:MAG: hypothetical protein N2746_02510 [Deltaproteobacteria bacterium]|nr:hypothetical protein [Deltaproteobacteria bacterium]